MGNCGVGFAPVRPGGEDFLIELMEGVEDIPGTALHEGIDWQWETLRRVPRRARRRRRARIDVAAQVPHAALRAYVMGERAHEDDRPPTSIAAHGRVWPRRRCAPARAGFTTSRTILHRSKHGLRARHLRAARRAVGHRRRARRRRPRRVPARVRRPRGAAPSASGWPSSPGAPASPSPTRWPRRRTRPTAYRDALADAERVDGRAALDIVPAGAVPADRDAVRARSRRCTRSSPTRPTGALADLPLAERVARLREPEVRAALLAEEPATDNPIARGLMPRVGPDVPPRRPARLRADPSSRASRPPAEREGRAPEEVVLDWLLERDGEALLFAPLASYVDRDHEAIREMIIHPRIGARPVSDGGAHCGLICDASACRPTCSPTGSATARRGERLPLEQAVHLQTGAHRGAYGFTDRGTLEPGKRADINLIDLDALDAARARDGASTCPPAAGASCSGSTATGDDRSPARSPSATASPPATDPAAWSASAVEGFFFREAIALMATRRRQ